MLTEKICFCWNINYRCNYRCPYCFFYNRWDRVVKDNGNFPAEDWIKSWRRIYDIYGSAKIETAGGEPFTFPSFVRCINEICKLHSLRITTNLSCSTEILKTIIGQNSPERLKWNITFHPSFANVDDFLKKALLLKRNKFEVLTMYVGYPPQLKMMPHFRSIFQENGITFFAQAFQGEHNRIAYPQGYTEEERQLMGDLKKDDCHGGLKRLIENQLLKKQTKGKLCLAGSKYAFVDSTGEVYKCSRERKNSMGNFLEHDFRLYDRPLPCEFEYCPCEFTWLVEEEAIREKQDMKDQDKIEADLPLTELSGKAAVCQTQDKYPAPGRVYWCWDIHNACNYKCPYCWLNTPHEDAPKDVHPYPGIDKLVKIWADIYKKYGRCHIHISGGEPSIYPSFFELIGKLSQLHYVEFDTNLSFDPVDLVRNTEEGRRLKIGATLHPEFTDLNTFFSKVLQLKGGGFRIGMTCVGYPPHLKDIRRYKDICDKNNVEFNIQAFRGAFNGKEYPTAYDDAEKELIGIQAEDVTSRILDYHISERDKKKEKVRRLCRMGQMGAKIYPNGDVFRCCMPEDDHRIGNIFNDDDFRLFDGPRYCEKSPCPCWRAMIIGKEDDWQHYWYRMETDSRYCDRNLQTKQD
ncbi:MAG: radical SAM protein [Candidatus Omnitrophica bacterium]|nr:radical SAM protein [Candidatus Omnitrophota bacterium]